jgi:Protein of unknown function (DUF3047)
MTWPTACLKWRPAALWLLALWGTVGAAADLLPLTGEGMQPPPPWHFVGLPFKSKPVTRFEVVELDGTRVLRIEADHSFGNLVHPLAAGTRAGLLSWRARIDQPTVGANLMRRSGEDMALRVCASFDLPLTQLPFLERQLLRVAQTASEEHLPSALLCYVADAVLPAGSLVVSPFTRRMRSIVVTHPAAGQWAAEQHDLGADFLRAFGDESSNVPPLRAVVVGADGDNTGSHSVAYVSALQHAPRP